MSVNRITVILSGKVVGHINEKDGGFQYVPKSSSGSAGPIYATVDEVKKSLENHDKPDRYIIVDLDGTVAERDPIQPFDDSTIIWRQPMKSIIELVLDLYACGYGIVFVTGRKYNTRPKTIMWIETHMMLEENDYHLFMRGDNDNRADHEIKLQIWEDCIKDKFSIKFVLDDRDQVVKMWRAQGLTCLQPADGNF